MNPYLKKMLKNLKLHRLEAKKTSKIVKVANIFMAAKSVGGHILFLLCFSGEVESYVKIPAICGSDNNDIL